jgi:hypothetical protein
MKNIQKKAKKTRKVVARYSKEVLLNLHQKTSKPLHSKLLKKFKLYARYWNWEYRRHIHIAGGILGALVVTVVIASYFHNAYALSTWTQSNWNGGVGTSTTNQYSSDTNLTTSTANQVTMPNSLTFSGNEITDTARTAGVQGDGITPPDSSTGIWEATTNLITNGGADSGITSTTSWGSGTTTVTRDTTTAKFGSAAFKVVTDGTAAGQGMGWTYPGGKIPISGSTTYTFSVWVKGNLGTESLVPAITWYDSTGATISSSPGTATTASTSWTQYTFTATSPSNAAGAIAAFHTSGTSAVTFWTDGAQLEQKAYATPYVDTNGATANRNAATMYAPTADTSMTQGWYATRVRMGVASTSGVDSYIAEPIISGPNRLALHANGGSWTIANDDSGVVNSTASKTSSYSVGTMVTAVFEWTATTIGVSVNGSAFTTVSRASVPAGALANFYLGSQASVTQLDGDIMWAASGTGTLTGTDATTLNALGSTDPTFSYLQSNLNNSAAPTMAWDGTSTTIGTTGTLVSAIYNSNLPENWGTLTYSGNIPSGSSISVYARGGNQPNLSDASAWSACSPISSGSSATSTCLPNKTQYAQYEVVTTGTSTATPTLTNVSLTYSPSDTTPPTVNASNIAMYRSNGGANISSGGWVNTDPYFTWTAGQDNSGGSGIAGYCLYLGASSSGNPETSSGDLGGTSPLNTSGTCPFAVSATDIDTSLSGIIATALASSNGAYYLNIDAIDNSNNVWSGSPASFEFYYDNTPPTNPAFISAPSEFVSNKQVDLTWPTTGSDAASDANSGIAGLQYRIGSSGTWYGVNHNGNQDSSDLLLNNGSYTTVSNPDFANLQEGNNLIYFRTWDNAGNISTAYVTTVVKINTTAPSSPQNLTATPTTNTTNSFAFSWLPPASYTGSSSNITYCYTVNVLPTSSNCTFTSPGVTSVSSGAYATEPGDNTFYVAAEDEAGNINYATASSVTFTANTPAPGIPLSLDIADISVKSEDLWKLALSWESPSSVGAGIATYKVYRSTDGTNYTDIASTAGTSYVDSGLSQQTYYYEIQACDSANNCGVLTSPVSLLPTGKYTAPANLVSGPNTSSVGTRTANVIWSTDRASDSSIEYGLSSGNYFKTQASNSDQATSHNIQLNNLQAGTTYYYRALWTDADGNTGTSNEMKFTTLPAPTVSNVSVSNINLYNATINFTTTGAAQAEVYYGPNGSFANTQMLNTSSSTSTYSVPLSSLSAGTTYTLKVDPFDSEGNEYDQTIFTFSTPQAPQISNIEFSPVPGALTGTEQVSWTTNVPTSSQISYAKQNQSLSSGQEAINSTLSKAHTITMSDLVYNTPYQLIATSQDALGNVANSDLQIFHTGLDTRPPIIGDVTIQPSIRGTGASASGQVIVAWKTDKPGSSQVAYGEGSGGGYTSKTAENTAQVTDHVVVISNLPTSQVFHLQAISKDVAGNTGVSKNQTTIIGQATESALDIVFNALQSVFGL